MEYHFYQTNTCCVCHRQTTEVIREEFGEASLCPTCKEKSQEDNNVLCLFYQTHYEGETPVRHTFVYGAIFDSLVVEEEIYGENLGELTGIHKISLECENPDEVLDSMTDRTSLYFGGDDWSDYPLEKTARDWECESDDF